MYLTVMLYFIGIDSPPRKYSSVCIQGKEVFVLLYSDRNYCIMTE